MQKKTIEEINEIYDLEIERVVRTIKKEEAKRVLLQFPEGLKPYSTVIADEIEKKAGSEMLIWLGTCFGACDIPLGTNRLGVDLIVQFGHSQWENKSKDISVV
jgi:2-(3-amino-3-carboxypropyl)histidine synthase